jgi:carboxymethylenebutenolidase
MTITCNESVDLTTPYGPMRTYVFRPTPPGRYPGMLLFSEIFQVTSPIRRTAAFLAGHGYLVAVPEIFHELEPPGAVIPYDQGGADRGNAHKAAKELVSYDADAKVVLAYLKAHSFCTGKIGTMGICIGGHLAFRAAMNPAVSAGACFYATDLHKVGVNEGMINDSLERSKELKAEMLMIWGRQDPHVPREARLLIYNALTAAGVTFTWHEFNAQHAFLRDEGYRYDPAASFQSLSLVLELFHRKLNES